MTHRIPRSALVARPLAHRRGPDRMVDRLWRARARPRPGRSTTSGRRPPARRPSSDRPGWPATSEASTACARFAVLTVIVFHLWPNHLPGGFLGVDVFFVISGLPHHHFLLREGDRSGPHRHARVLDAARPTAAAGAPAVVVTSLVVAWLVSRDLLVDADRRRSVRSPSAATGSRCRPGSDYFDATSPALFVTFWSLPSRSSSTCCGRSSSSGSSPHPRRRRPRPDRDRSGGRLRGPHGGSRRARREPHPRLLRHRHPPLRPA